MNARTIVALALLALACAGPRPTGNAAHTGAAMRFTRQYAHSRLSDWKIRATAAGDRCDVLLIETSIMLEDSMVDALHYGAGEYGVYTGGIQRFSTEHEFRSVVYKDSTAHVWIYGDISAAGAQKLKRCH